MRSALLLAARLLFAEPEVEQAEAEMAARPTFGLGAGIGIVSSSSRALTGIDDASTGRVTPALTQSIWLSHPGLERAALGIELTERWWSVSIDRPVDEGASHRHHVARSVFVVDALFCASGQGDNVRFVVGVGPSLQRISMDERTPLETTRAIDVRPGLRAAFSPRVMIGSSLAIAIDASVDLFVLPRRSALVHDGGAVWTGMLAMRFEGLL